MHSSFSQSYLLQDLLFSESLDLASLLLLLYKTIRKKNCCTFHPTALLWSAPTEWGEIYADGHKSEKTHTKSPSHLSCISLLGFRAPFSSEITCLTFFRKCPNWADSVICSQRLIKSFSAWEKGSLTGGPWLNKGNNTAKGELKATSLRTQPCTETPAPSGIFLHSQGSSQQWDVMHSMEV